MSGPPRIPLAERFWPRVKPTPSGCWEWTGARQRTGYGRVSRGGAGNGLVGAHRAAWELTRGPIPAGLWVLHKCDNPPCCNPDHLFLGTAKDNNADRGAKGRSHSRLLLGELNGRAKLTAAQVAEIRSRHVRGTNRHRPSNTEELAREYGVSPSHIRAIASCRAWVDEQRQESIYKTTQEAQ